LRVEITPGSPQEYRAIDVLKGLFKDLSDWIRVVMVPTDTWIEEKCLVEVAGREIACKAMPYVTSTELEGNIVKARIRNGEVFLEKSAEYPIVFVEFPEEIDTAKYIVLDLYEMGASAVVFYDRYPGRYRRTVITGSRSYSFNHGSPPPVPVVSITREDYASIVKSGARRARIYVSSRVIHGAEGKILIAGFNGRSDKEIHVTAHHDHWFTGFSDDLVGVEVLYQVGRRLREKHTRSTVLLISYTSEELGAPNYTSWYWAWGSRFYLSILYEKNMLDYVIADINIDSVCSSPLEVHGNPALKPCVDRIASKYRLVYKGYDHMDFDSFSYTLRGVPALTINTLDAIGPVYHSNHDDGRGFNYELLNTLVDVVDSFIACLETSRPSYKALVEHVKERVGDDAPVEARILVAKLETLPSIIEDEDERIRLITRLLSHAVYMPSIKFEYQTDILGEILFMKKLATNINNYAGRIVVVKNFDRDVVQLALARNNLDEAKRSLWYYISVVAQNLDRVLSAEIGRYIMVKNYKKRYNIGQEVK